MRLVRKVKRLSPLMELWSSSSFQLTSKQDPKVQVNLQSWVSRRVYSITLRIVPLIWLIQVLYRPHQHRNRTSSHPSKVLSSTNHSWRAMMFQVERSRHSNSSILLIMDRWLVKRSQNGIVTTIQSTKIAKVFKIVDFRLREALWWGI